MIGVPTREQVRAWIQVPASALSDADLDQILEAELAIQSRTCRVPVDPDLTGPATLVVDGYDAAVTVAGGPPGRHYRILWGDGTTDVTLDQDGAAYEEHAYSYAGTYPAVVYDVDLERNLLEGTVTVPGDQVLPTQATYPAALARACLRRCQREVAARAVPLGAFGIEGNEYGPTALPRWDAEIVRLEASYRIPVIA